jgi:glycosyltransferase involved in cell wall biosynthesis
LSSDLLWLDEHHELSAIYSAFDVSVLCSKSEGFPNVVLESLACGTPCVVTRSSGDASIIVGPFGITCDSDAAQLAKALREVCAAKGRWDEGEIARATLARYDQENLFTRTEELLAGPKHHNAGQEQRSNS